MARYEAIFTSLKSWMMRGPDVSRGIPIGRCRRHARRNATLLFAYHREGFFGDGAHRLDVFFELKVRTGRTCRQPSEACAYMVPLVPCLANTALSRSV